MNLQILQHVDFEGPGRITEWADDRGHDWTITKLFDAEPLPASDAFDWLVVMGGPMSVHDESVYPWLEEEKRLIRATIDGGKPVFGVCLGAQLIADALGAEVRPCETPEHGWHPAHGTEAATNSSLFSSLPERYDVLHWHGETFDLPAGAHRMARTPACENQAFVYEETVVGLQFHLETTPETLEELLANDSPPDTGPYTQPAAEIRSQTERLESLEAWLPQLLDGIEARASHE